MLFIITAVTMLFAAPETPGDSLRAFRLDDVVVTGTRTAVAIRDLPSPVHVTDSAVMARMNGMSVADKLAGNTGVLVQRYGGPASLHSVSVRGMGSDYSLILVDGIRFTTYQIGTVDLGIFPDQDVERIETANGGSSALYGADAVGGVINIITKRADHGPGLSVAYTGGSFGLTGFQLQAGANGEGGSLRASAGMQRASNAFPYRLQDGATLYRLQRTGADFVTRTGSVSYRKLIDDIAVSTITARYSEAERGQPAAVTGPLPGASARIHDKDLFLTSTTVVESGGGMELTIPLSWHLNRQLYNDPLLITNGRALASEYENVIMSAAPQLHLQLSPDHSVTAGVEFGNAIINSNELHPSDRRQTSLYLSSQHHSTEGVDLLIYPSFRYDSFNDVAGDVSVKLGVNAGLADAPLLRVRGSIGRNYRVPTFNDLYWIDGGNPALTPEDALNADAGILAGFRTDHLDIDGDIGWFGIEASNKIIWLPGTNGRWTPRNVQSVLSRGLEVRVQASVEQDLLNVRFQYTQLSTTKTSSDGPDDPTAGKQLPYVPKRNLSVTAAFSLSGFSLASTYTYTSSRFITADNDPRYFLPTVATVDANAGYRCTVFGPLISLRGEVNNLTNVNYLMVSGYPLPLRNYRFRTEIAF